MTQDPSETLTLSSPVLRQLHEYWTAKRSGRAMPKRAEIDPLDIAPLLRFVFMLDVERTPLRFRYRLIGTGIVAATGRDLTGAYLDQQTFGDRYDAIAAAYRLVVEQRAPLGRRGAAHWVSGRDWAIIETLVLPLGDSDVTILLGGLIVDPRAGDPEWRARNLEFRRALNPTFENP